MYFFLQHIFPLAVNFGEASLMLYLFYKKLTLCQRRWLILICYLSLGISTSIKSLFQMNQMAGFILLLLFDVLIATVISTSPLSEKIFWGSIYTVVYILADTLTFQIGGLLTSYSAFELLYDYPVNMLMTLLYLFFCWLGVFLLTRFNQKNLAFPRYLDLVFILLICVGMFAVESLLDLLVDLNVLDMPQKYTLYFSINAILVIFIALIFFIQYLGVLYQKNLELAEENRQKTFEQQQYEFLSHTTEILRTFKHDLHHHISVLQLMAEEKKFFEIKEYLSAINEELTVSGWHIHTGNSALDAVISSKYASMKKYRIQFSHNIFLPKALPLKDFELTSVVGNLFDNAIESCQKTDPGIPRFIRFEIKPRQQNLFLEIINSSAGQYRFNPMKKLVSSKQSEGHGIGLRRVEQIVTQANGFLQIIPEADLFRVQIIFSLKEEIPT